MVSSTMSANTGDKDDLINVDGGEEFVVERIVSHRFRNGRKEYYLQWKGYSEEDNTWEPEQNLDCPDLIEEYENRIAQKPRYTHDGSSSTNLKRKSSLDQASVPNRRGRPPNDSLTNRNYVRQQTNNMRNEEVSAFDRGLEAEKILGATDSTGELMLLVQWKGTSEADLVPARICNVKCPQVVIRFYEERLTWITTQQQQQSAQTLNDNNHNTADNRIVSEDSGLVETDNHATTL